MLATYKYLLWGLSDQAWGILGLYVGKRSHVEVGRMQISRTETGILGLCVGNSLIEGGGAGFGSPVIGGRPGHKCQNYMEFR